MDDVEKANPLNSLATQSKACLLALAIASGAANAGDTYTKAGDLLALGLPAVAAGLAIAQDDADGLLQLAKSEAFTLVTTLALKEATHKTRPNGKDDQSFPSGHASVAFAAAQFMQMRGGWEFGVPAYVLASVVGHSRVQAKEHYWRDVVAGAAIGIASSYYFTDNTQRTRFGVMFGPRSAQAQYSKSW